VIAEVPPGPGFFFTQEKTPMLNNRMRVKGAMLFFDNFFIDAEVW